VALTAAALALYGLIRFVFNAVAVRIFGAEFVGVVGVGSSWATLAAVLIASAPAVVVSRFVAERRGRGEDERAAAVFAGVLLLSGSALAGAAVVLAFVPALAPVRLLALYAPGFGFYLLLKAGYLAWADDRRYFAAEIVSSVAFFAAFAAACAARSPLGATASLLVHPLAFGLLAAFRLRRRMRLSGALRELRAGAGTYAPFLGASFVNALGGLGGYHLIVVAAGAILRDPADVGYVALILASLSPLNLAPQALGAVLLPELAFRSGAGDADATRRLVRRSVAAMQGFAVVAGVPLLAFPGFWMARLGVPDRGDLRVAWVLLALPLLVAMISAPCGHLLNATRHAAAHARATAATLLAGLGVGWLALAAWGVPGAGLFRFVGEIPLALFRMARANREAAWAEGRRGLLAGTLLALGAAAVIGALAARP
jgi:O-antigen/teichoic acid export membrane protein